MRCLVMWKDWSLADVYVVSHGNGHMECCSGDEWIVNEAWNGERRNNNAAATQTTREVTSAIQRPTNR